MVAHRPFQGRAASSRYCPSQLSAPVPRNPHGSPAYYNDVAVLALSAEESWPGFDFVFDLAPGTHREPGDAAQCRVDSSVKEFVIYASESGSEAADFREAFRGTLQARTGAQSFTIPAARAKFLKLRVVSGHDPGGRVAPAEFEAFSADANNVVTVQTGPMAAARRSGAWCALTAAHLGRPCRKMACVPIHRGQ